jgi:hypothetical protein
VTRSVAGAIFFTLCTALPLTAQVPPLRYELGPQLFAAPRDPALVGGGLFAAVRPGGNARVAANLVGAVQDGTAVGRGELLAQFVLGPRQLRGVSPYGLGGIAGETGRGMRGYLVLGAGLESAPGRRSGWAVEAGVGGGVRLAAGWRWRW